ncbi:MAG: sugar ABC transporter ATP-binding protein [Treponema sp.]|nr:sugar ABC transporter ATP-binding protein [Treponema sp.]
MQAILTFHGIDKHFGGIHALKDVSFEIEKGQVCALMGENGAGKSTLGKVITGVVQSDSGAMEFEGRPHDPHSSLDAQRDGISIIFQELDLFPHQSVAQNLIIGNLKLLPRQAGFLSDRALDAMSRPWLERVGLDLSPSTPLGRLPIAHVQLVSIARALSMESRLIVMDEPTSAITNEAVDTLFSLIESLKKDGVTIIFISHKMDEIFRIADSIVVMRDGAYIGTKRRTETSPGEIVSMMVGRQIPEGSHQKSWKKDKVVLSFDSVSTAKLKKVSFELHEGEVLGVAGLVGAGRSELGAALFGIDAIREGSIALEGRRIEEGSPRKSLKRGIGLIPEDRKLQGLLMQQSVRDNVALAVVERNHILGFMKRSHVNSLVGSVFESTRIKAASPEVCINTLSGGNQQKALVGRWLLVGSQVLFLDDPTRGVDIGAKEDIYQIIGELAEKGRSIIFVSSELPELLRCADRILVLCQGEIMGALPAEKTNQEEIMRLAMGLNRMKFADS